METGLQDIRVLLRGYGGEAPTGTAFLDLLGWEPLSGFSAYPSQSSWQGACVELFALAVAELQEFTEPTEEFAARTERGLLRVLALKGMPATAALRRLEDLRVIGREQRPLLTLVPGLAAGAATRRRAAGGA
jgi:hypothetical protein